MNKLNSKKLVLMHDGTSFLSFRDTLKKSVTVLVCFGLEFSVFTNKCSPDDRSADEAVFDRHHVWKAIRVRNGDVGELHVEILIYRMKCSTDTEKQNRHDMW